MLDHPIVDGTVNTFLRANGALYIGGNFHRIAARRGSLQRLDPLSGAFLGTPPEVAGGQVMAIIPDGAGGWYIAGDFSHVGGVHQPGLARIDDNGTVDTAFRPIIVPQSSFNPREVRSLVLSSGYLYAGGRFNAGGTAINHLARFDPVTGAVDAGFNPAPNLEITDMVLTTGGRILVGGSFDSIFAQSTRQHVAAFNPATGLLDSGFYVSIANGINRTVYDIEYDALSNQAYLCYNNSSSNRDYIVRVAATTGTLDTTFVSNIQGVSVTRAVLDGAGGLVFVGNFIGIGSPVTARSFMARFLTPTGQPDLSFNPAPDLRPTALNLQSPGLFQTGGTFTMIGGLARFKQARLLAGGTADTSWTTSVWEWLTHQVDGSGNLLVGGGPSADGLMQPYLVKVDPLTGAVDTGFAPVLDGEVKDLAVEGGDLLVAGSFLTANGSARRGLARLDWDDGSTVTSFNAQLDEECEDIAVIGGALYAGGRFLNAGGLARRRLAKLDPASGAADAAFSSNPSNSVVAIVDGGSGALVVGGSFGWIGGLTRTSVSRISAATGLADPGFSQPFTYGTVYDIVPGPPGWAYVCGNATSTEKLPMVNLVTGAQNTGFAAPSVTNNFIYTAVFDGGSGLYAGSSTFAVMQGVTRNSLVRLDAYTGAFDGSFTPLTASGNVLALDLDNLNQRLAVGGALEGMGGKATNGYGIVVVEAPGPVASPTISATVTPSPSASRTPTSTRSPTASPSETRTPSPTLSPSFTGTESSTATPSPSPSFTSSESPSATPSLTTSPAASATDSPTPTPSSTETPSASPSASPSGSPSATPSATESPTESPTWSHSPVASPTESPTISVTPTATGSETVSVTASPSLTASPTASGTGTASASPSLTSSTSPTPSATLTPSPTPMISDLAFSWSPSALTVTVGTTVTWGWLGTHDVRSDDSLFSSGAAVAGGWLAYTFNTPGSFRYYCSLHGGPGGSGMSGIIYVIDPSTPTVSPTASPTGSFSPSPTVSASASPTPTATASLTLVPTLTGTPSASPTSSPSPSPVPSPSISATLTPSPTAGGTSPTPTVFPTASWPEVESLVAMPNPNPVAFKVLLKGGAEQLRLRAYSPAMVLLFEDLSGPHPSGWVSLPVPSGLRGLANGLYFVEASAGGPQSLGKQAQASRVMLIR